MEGKQKCRICGKHRLKFWIFRSDCWEDFQSEAEHFNKLSVWHFSFKKTNQNSYWGQHNVSVPFFGSTSSILNSGRKIVAFWEDLPAMESCEEPALCVGTAGATRPGELL